MNRTGIEAALGDLLFNHDITLEEAAERHFTPGYRQRTDGDWADRAEFLDHISHLRGIVAAWQRRGPRRAVRRQQVRRPAHLPHHQERRHHRHHGGLRLRRPRPRRPLPPHRGNHPDAERLRRRPQHRQRPLTSPDRPLTDGPRAVGRHVPGDRSRAQTGVHVASVP